MDQPEPEQQLSSAWKWRHPLLEGAPIWVMATLFLAIGLAMSAALLATFPAGRVPGLYPFPPIAGGLVVGLIGTVLTKRRLSRQVEEHARALVYPPERRFRLTRWHIAGGIALVAVIFCWIALEDRLQQWFGLGLQLHAALAVGAAALPGILLYPDHRRIYLRAREIATRPETLTKAYPNRAVESYVPWPHIVGVLAIVALLAAGVWMQWVAPWSRQAEPSSYETVTEPGGRATRLTYGLDATSPAVSPDGRLIACVRMDLPNSHLEIMRADGRSKRRVEERLGVSPVDLKPITWLAGNQLLLEGQPYRKARSVTEALETDRWQVDQGLWVADIARGRARRLASVGRTGGVVWVPEPDRVVVLDRVSQPNELTMISLAGDASARHMLPKLPVERPAFALWRGSRLLVTDPRHEAGIWEIAQGAVRKLSGLPAAWVLPLDDRRLLIGREAGIPRIQTTFGIFDTQAGSVRWLPHTTPGAVDQPTLLGQRPVVVFLADSYARQFIKQGDLYALRLTDGAVSRLTHDRSILQFSPAPSGDFIAFTDTAEASPRTWITHFGSSIWRLDLSPDGATTRPRLRQ